MSRSKSYLRIAGTVLCAMSLGFVVQTYTAQDSLSATAASIQPVSAVTVQDIQPANIELQDITLTSAVVPGSGLTDPSIAPTPPRDPETPVLGCQVTTKAVAGVAATVSLDILAPCFPNERVTIHHQGMMFTDVVDKTGHLNLQVPVLSERQSLWLRSQMARAV